MTNGETIEINVIDMTDDGDGIGKAANGMTVFVRGAVIGDKVQVRLDKIKKRYAQGECVLIEERSPFRKPSADGLWCKWQGTCGGCGLAELAYDAQCRLKEKHIRDKLTRIAGIENPLVRDIITMDTEGEIARYRNKAVISVGENSLGEPVVGFKKKGSLEVVDCDYCQLQMPPAMAVAEVLRQFLREGVISPYIHHTGQGLLRHVIVKTSVSTGEVMVILVVKENKLPEMEELIYAMDDAVEDTGYSLESVYLNINSLRSSEVMGDKTVLLAGKKTIMDNLCGLNFEISPRSFYQVNPEQAEKLYGKALEYAGITSDKNVLDIYCGVGTIGLIAAAEGAGNVLGIEAVRDAVLDANRNAVINGIVNIRFINSRAEDVEYSEVAESGEYHVAILDPPRRGCDVKLLMWVAELAPERIIYISCEPGTMARDIAILRDNGYRFVEATPCDMFPQTTGIECVAFLEKHGG